MNVIALYKVSFSGLGRQVWYLALMMLVNRMGSLILPFLTLYTTQQLGWSKVDSGIASAAFGVGSMCGAYIGGRLVDRYGYWRMIILGQFGAGIGFMLLQFISDFYVLSLGLFLSALIADVLRPAVMTGVGIISSEENRTRGISLMRLAFNLGYSIGPAMAGFLIAMTSYRSIFIADSLTCIAAGIFGYYMIDRDREKNNFSRPKADESITNESPLKDGPFIAMLAASFLMLLAFFQIIFTVPLYMKEELGLDEKAVGLYFAINGLIIVISEMPIVYLTEKKWRLMPAMILGTLMVGGSYLCLNMGWSPWYLMGGYLILISYGEIVNFPFINSISLRRTTRRNIGAYMGMIAMMFSLSLIFAPILGTQIITLFGYSSLWWTCAILCLISAFGYKWVEKDFAKPHS